MKYSSSPPLRTSDLNWLFLPEDAVRRGEGAGRLTLSVFLCAARARSKVPESILVLEYRLSGGIPHVKI